MNTGRGLPRLKVWLLHISHRFQLEFHKSEFQELCNAAAFDIVGATDCKSRDIEHFKILGTGQLDEVCTQINDADQTDVVIVCSVTLTPRQEKYLREQTRKVVMDRTAVILQLFSERATTRQAKIQVEMAMVEYEAGRLVRLWDHLERQRGGRGLRSGPGERQLEIDKRLLSHKRKKLRKQMDLIGRQSNLRKTKRDLSRVPEIVLVGYTNAGKTTLLQKLVDPKALPEDRLFATLETKSRKWWLGTEIGNCVLSDTVGFVSDLPHQLIEAFRSTLSHVVEADLLLVVVDVADDRWLEQQQVVSDTLTELGADSVPMLIVANKCDKNLAAYDQSVDQSVWGEDAEVHNVSAATGQGLEALRNAVIENLHIRIASADLPTRPLV